MQNYKVTAAILAGGKSMRFRDGDKINIKVNSTHIIDHLIKSIPKKLNIIVNTNSIRIDPTKNKLTIVKDRHEGYLGPLAGIYSSMMWASINDPKSTHILSIPIDNPLISLGNINKILKLSKNHPKKIIVASWNGSTNPVFGIWPIEMSNKLNEDISNGARSVEEWSRNNGRLLLNYISFADPFININTIDDLKSLESRLTLSSSKEMM
ncbi:MAG: molybdenum cofactor guanylyltransferase [Hyphomicrobiales bacterium]|jgi:molybdopterin-guanine dinucleotide biosynthesis protein A